MRLCQTDEVLEKNSTFMKNALCICFKMKKQQSNVAHIFSVININTDCI